MFDSRKWVGGEVIQALAYDVPIPGYKTKNTISLRLWEAKASAGDFNLFQFNDGQYESAAQLHSKAQQVCCLVLALTTDYCVFFQLSFFFFGLMEICVNLDSLQICAVLYPGDATESGKILRLKQQYFLCSASLQVCYKYGLVIVSIHFCCWLVFTP